MRDTLCYADVAAADTLLHAIRVTLLPLMMLTPLRHIDDAASDADSVEAIDAARRKRSEGEGCRAPQAMRLLRLSLMSDADTLDYAMPLRYAMMMAIYC